MDLHTKYLGITLAHPLMPGASPMVDDMDLVRRLEDAGASAIVMHSLFEEQLTGDHLGADQHIHAHSNIHAEAQSYLPDASIFALGPDEYLEQIRRIRAAVRVPVIASLNGSTPGGWLDYARGIQAAGAHALELNLYTLATDVNESAAAIEGRLAGIVAEVRRNVHIPVAVKLSPFFSALPQFATRLERAGADGLVLFNRFYQPDIDVEDLEVRRALRLSSSSELLLRLRWLAILSGKVKGSLAVTGGVHNAVDAVKAIMAGADAVQMVSALLQRGPDYLRVVRQELGEWLEQHEYSSLAQMRGSMSLDKCPDPSAYERGNYVAILQGWRPAPHDPTAISRR
jgi:dihydroorotate dehydrogenase (fumarate)